MDAVYSSMAHVLSCFQSETGTAVGSILRLMPSGQIYEVSLFLRLLLFLNRKLNDSPLRNTRNTLINSAVRKSDPTPHERELDAVRPKR